MTACTCTHTGPTSICGGLTGHTRTYAESGSHLAAATEGGIDCHDRPCVVFCRAASSVASSQGSPGSNAAEAAQLDDYAGRHASPQRIASGRSVITQGQDHDISYASGHDSPQLTQQKSGLWGVESTPGSQPSVVARASSPPQRQTSQSSQRSGILRTGSGGSSKYKAESDADSRVEPMVEPRVESRVPSGRAHKSPVRAPSRLRESTTEEAEVHYAHPPRKAHQSSRDSSAEEEEEDLHQKPYKQKPRALVSVTSTDEEEDEQQTPRHRHSPRVSQASRQKPKGTTTQPHQHYHTAEEYFSRARVREALSPRRQPAHTSQYPAKARVLDLHDNCTLADEQQDDLCCGAYPSQHARDSGRSCAQVCGLPGRNLYGSSASVYSISAFVNELMSTQISTLQYRDQALYSIKLSSLPLVYHHYVMYPNNLYWTPMMGSISMQGYTANLAFMNYSGQC